MFKHWWFSALLKLESTCLRNQQFNMLWLNAQISRSFLEHRRVAERGSSTRCGTQHKWLGYSQSQDYCLLTILALFACRHFSLPNAPETPFTSRNKDSQIEGDDRPEGHIKAMFVWSEPNRSTLTNLSLRGALDKAYRKRVEENRTHIKTVAEVLLLTALQNIPQRGSTLRQMHHTTGVTF